MKHPEKHPLSHEFMIACEIYKITEIDQKRAFFKNLVKNLEGELSASTIWRMLVRMRNFGLLSAEHGITKDGKVTRHYHIARDAEPLVIDLYKKYWSDRT